MKALKFILIPVVSITSLFCIILIASFIGDIGTISHPATIILPLITLFTFLTGTIMLTVWSCLWNQNNNRKKLLKISGIITAFSIVVLFISIPVNRLITSSIKATAITNITDFETAFEIDINKKLEQLGEPSDKDAINSMKYYSVKPIDNQTIDIVAVYSKTTNDISEIFLISDMPMYDENTVVDYYLASYTKSAIKLLYPSCNEEDLFAKCPFLESGMFEKSENNLYKTDNLSVMTSISNNNTLTCLLVLGSSTLNKASNNNSNEGTPEKEPAPEPTYEPVIYSGTGDSVVNIEFPDKGYCLYHITGNSASSHFSVQAYDKNDDLDLLVNVTKPYNGTTFSSKNIVLLEIKAVGDWSIEINHISKGKLIEKDITLTGTGDDVLIAPGGIGAITAEINGNSASSHFAVKSYTEDSDWDLLVNATDPYSGTVKISKETRLFEIKAVGDWSITCK